MKKPNRYEYIQAPEQKDYIWTDKKRPFFGIPLSFTRYTVYADRVLIDRGFVFRRHDEIRLYRVMDLKVVQGPIQRLFGIGNVILLTADASTPRFVLQDVMQPKEVMMKLSDLAEEERKRVRVGVLESYGAFDSF